MTLNRYEKLSQYLHLNSSAAQVRRDDPGYHPLNKLRPLVDMTTTNFLKYQHGTEVCVDEAMKSYKGRSDIRQFMPNKPDRFGFKFW